MALNESLIIISYGSLTIANESEFEEETIFRASVDATFFFYFTLFSYMSFIMYNNNIYIFVSVIPDDFRLINNNIL